MMYFKTLIIKLFCRLMMQRLSYTLRLYLICYVLLMNPFNIIHNNLLVNKLTLNISKTKFMILSPRPHRLARNPDHVISVNSFPIFEVHSFRFLGVTLSSNLTWKSHIKSIHRKLHSRLGIIYKARYCLNTSC